jgi:hypothetical protein
LSYAVDIVFCIDVTGSMTPILDAVKAHAVVRPTIGKIHATLMGIRTGTPDMAATPTPPTAPSMLRGKGLRASRPTTPADPDPAPRGRLVGKLISKIADRPHR